MKAKFFHKLRGPMTLKHACLLILLTSLMTSSLTVFAACPPGGQGRAKGGQPSVKTPSAKGVQPPQATSVDKTPSGKKSAVKISTVVVVFNPANSATPATPPPQMTTEMQALTTPKSFPLYYYSPDVDPEKPICLKTLMLAPNVTCTAAWPPLLQTSGSSLTVTGLSKKLAVSNNDNGQQITFNGHLLYTYAKDQMPLIAIGDGGKSGPWHIATPDIPVLKPVAAPDTTVLLPDSPVGSKPVATPNTPVEQKPVATPDIPVGQKPVTTPDTPVGQKPVATPDTTVGKKPVATPNTPAGEKPT
jgi:predicted lipoprotein with Yx(FWY)xxD motif